MFKLWIKSCVAQHWFVHDIKRRRLQYSTSENSERQSKAHTVFFDRIIIIIIIIIINCLELKYTGLGVLKKGKKERKRNRCRGSVHIPCTYYDYDLAACQYNCMVWCFIVRSVGKCANSSFKGNPQFVQRGFTKLLRTWAVYSFDFRGLYVYILCVRRTLRQEN